MARAELTENDEGKQVINADGESIGVISGFRGGRAYIDPDPGITEKIMARLGWEDVEEDHYPLDSDRVETVTDDEVRLEETM